MPLKVEQNIGEIKRKVIQYALQRSEVGSALWGAFVYAGLLLAKPSQPVDGFIAFLSVFALARHFRSHAQMHGSLYSRRCLVK